MSAGSVFITVQGRVSAWSVDGHLVVQEVPIGLVEENPLLDDVSLSSCSGIPLRSKCARTLEVAGLDFEHVVFAVAVLIDPLADGIAVEAGLGLACGHARPSV